MPLAAQEAVRKLVFGKRLAYHGSMKNGRWISGVAACWVALMMVSEGAPVPPVAIANIRRANDLAAAGREKEALEMVEQCLEAVKGGDHDDEPAYGDILCTAAKIRRSCGDAKGGLEVARRALEAAQNRQVKSEHGTGLAYVAIAMCQASLKNEKEAQKAAQAGWEVLGKVPYRDPAVPNLIPRCHAMSNLGGVYHSLEDYLMAEKYYRLAAADGDRLMGFPLQGASYDLGKFAAAGRAFASLGGFYALVGDYERAIPLLVKSVETRGKAAPSSMPSNSLEREHSYISLSRAYLGLGNTEMARRYSYNAMRTAAGGRISERYVVAQGTLASVHDEVGEYEEALKLMKEMMEQQRTIRNDESFEDPRMVNNLGWVHLRMGKLAEARKLLTKAYFLTKEEGEEQSELAGNILFSLCEVEFLDGNPKRAVKGLKKAMQVYEREVERVVGFGSDSQKLAYLQRLRGKTDFVMGMHFGRYPDEEDLAREALAMLFQRKDRMTQLSRSSAELTRAVSATSAARRKVEKVRSRLGLLSLSLGVFNRDIAVEFGQDWMVELEEGMRELSEEGRGSKRPEREGPGLAEVAEELEEGEVLAEYVIYRSYDPKVPGARKDTLPLRCGVFVLDSTGAVSSLDLGEFAKVQEWAVEFRRSLSRPGDEEFRELGKQLYARLVAPVEKLTGGASTWRIAPDGQLHLIPFEAMIDGEGKFLTEKRAVTYLATGGDLAQQEEKGGAKGGKVTIFSGPEYSIKAPRKASQSVAEGIPPNLSKFWEDVSTIGAPLQFPALAGTVREAEMIKKVFPEAEVVQGKTATESAVRRLADSRVIHLATHGFYLNEDVIAMRGQRGLKRVKPAPVQGVDPKKAELQAGNWTGQRSLDHPLLNCGLAFTGANQLHDGSDDGVLTGMEVLGMDLRQTGLVVLSACETGVGKVVSGEGVVGLRQAFRVAGADSMVMSLWKVADEATAELMAHFYRGLADGKTKGEALRSAAAEVRGQEKWSHPAYWAAFLLSGEDGSL